MKKTFWGLSAVLAVLAVGNSIHADETFRGDNLRKGAAMIFEDSSLPLAECGRLRRVSSREIASSSISVGMECLDRDMFDFDRAFRPLGESGVKWARVQTGWNKCETVKGKLDFRWLDHIVDSLISVGVEPWFNVSYGNKLYMKDVFTDAAVGFVPLYYGEECLKAWKHYVFELSKHFKGRVRRWEIWNEPEGSGFWNPKGANGAEYARLIRETTPEIRENIPDAEIGACSSTMIHPDRFPEFVKSGILSEINFFCGHYYTIVPEKNFRNLTETIRRVFDANGGKQVKIGQGESGYASWFPKNHWMKPYVMSSQRNQAKWLLRRGTTDLACGLFMTSFFQMVDMVKAYSMGDVTRPAPARHGLLDGETYQPKMSFHAMSHLAAVFDSDTRPTPLYGDLDTYSVLPREIPVSRLMDTSRVVYPFVRNGYPLFVYYLPEDVQMEIPGYKNAKIYLLPGETEKHLKDPVLIDLMSGLVYRPASLDRDADGNIRAVGGLPLTDYPLVLTDSAALGSRIVYSSDSSALRKDGKSSAAR